MKSLLVLATLATMAFAGDTSSGSAYRCWNDCPLAKQANACRSFGNEALATSRIARAELSKTVVDNLARI